MVEKAHARCGRGGERARERRSEGAKARRHVNSLTLPRSHAPTLRRSHAPTLPRSDAPTVCIISTSMIPELSVVIPVRNESPNVDGLYRDFTGALERWGRSYEIII